MFDDEISSLVSLLGLLEPSEYFITVDNSALWQKHISWAKSKGEDLRSHITQRYASSMVFLSCLLAAQINVFFNSSKEITEMRSCLATQRMFTLKYWIGVVIMTDICVTILALVNTYTLSKLIASISDSNAHAMLRSSIGSYVAVLPSRFTVAALYLFLIWIALFIWDFFTGPIHYFLLLMVLTMFFHVIIPLSAFGRLIIHTGAMGRRPVLDVELEKELLPSGLHNSLLIRATDRKRKYNSSATDLYRNKQQQSQANRSGGVDRNSSRGVYSANATTGSSMPSSTVYGTSHNNAHPHHQNTRASSSYRTHTTTSHHPPRNIAFGRPAQYQHRHEDSDDLTMEGEESAPLLVGGGGGGRNTTTTTTDDNINTEDDLEDPDDHMSDDNGNNFHPRGFDSGGDSHYFDPSAAESFMMHEEDGGGDYYQQHPNTGNYYGPPRGHRRIQTVDTVGSDNFFFPGAAILNATTRTKDIHDIVQRSMYLSESGASNHNNTHTHNTDGSSTLYSMASGDLSSQHPPNQQQQQQQHPFGYSQVRPPPPPSSAQQQQQQQGREENPEDIVPAAKDAETKDRDDTNEDTAPLSAAAVAANKNGNTIPGTINSPAGLTRNISTASSGHRRPMSSGGVSPRLTLPLPPTTPESLLTMRTPTEQHRPILPPTEPTMMIPQQQDDIHAGMRYPSPDIPSSHTSASRKFFATSPQTPQSAYHRQQQQESQEPHPLLVSPPGAAGAAASRPPTHRQMNRHTHRRRSSASRRSSGSFLGFIPLPSPAEEELEEDNAIRASMGMPLAPDLESQERLVEEQKNHDYSEEAPPPETVASAWLAMHQTTTPGGAGDRRRSSSSTGNIHRDAEEVRTSSGGGYRSNSRRNLMITALNSPNDGGVGQQQPRSNSRRNLMANDSGTYRSNSRRNLARQGSDEQYRSGSRRNLMATISSHPDEEKEEAKQAEEEERARRPSHVQNWEASTPEETTRLLTNRDEGGGGGNSDGAQDGGNSSGRAHRSYT